MTHTEQVVNDVHRALCRAAGRLALAMQRRVLSKDLLERSVREMREAADRLEREFLTKKDT